MADSTATLSDLRIEPLINELEIVTAVIDLSVTVACQLPGLHDHHRLLAAISNSCKHLCEMYGGVGVMSDPEQQDLPVQVVDAADRTVQAMRNIQGMIGGDPGGFRSEG
ncbi:MAG TPA: hypothetical protein VM818_00975 [Vicinamibacterales bacterium]|nr:hypothetical protein [Vicinamibacterales bacterium]